MHPHLRKPISRRACLRGLGAAVSLPLLEAMLPRSAAAIQAVVRTPRFVAASLAYGLYPRAFFPATRGKNYALTPLLAPLAAHRDRFTVFTGLDHNVNGAHVIAQSSFLSSVDFRVGEEARTQPTLDQVVALNLGDATRFRSLELGVSTYDATGRGASVSEHGVWLPRMLQPRDAFQAMFVTGTKAESSSPELLLRRESVLDRVRAQARRLESKLGAADRQKLDEYFTSVRTVEQNIERTRTWSKRPVPRSPRRMKFNVAGDAMRMQALMYDLIVLGLQTDSSRVFSLLFAGRDEVLELPGVSVGYHNLSHHGKSPEKLDQLLVIELEHMRQFARFLADLAATEDATGTSLFDTTTVLFGSGLGNGSSHSNKELPVIVAGGGIEHQGSLVYSGTDKRPLANLYLNLLQHLGIETDAFGSSTGRLAGFA